MRKRRKSEDLSLSAKHKKLGSVRSIKGSLIESSSKKDSDYVDLNDKQKDNLSKMRKKKNGKD
jgi:hypothetical protein